MSDDGCTLRGAVAVAADGDDVWLSPTHGDPVDIELQSPLVMDRPIALTAQGWGSDRLAVRAADLFRVLIVGAGVVTLSDLTIRDG